jgi:hypothetical protein
MSGRKLFFLYRNFSWCKKAFILSLYGVSETFPKEMLASNAKQQLLTPRTSRATSLYALSQLTPCTSLILETISIKLVVFLAASNCNDFT